MSLRNDVVTKTKAINEIIDNASALPIECQGLLLSIAKGMAFTKRCLLNQGYLLPLTSEAAQQKESQKSSASLLFAQAGQICSQYSPSTTKLEEPKL